MLLVFMLKKLNIQWNADFTNYRLVLCADVKFFHFYFKTRTVSWFEMLNKNFEEEESQA